MLRPSFGLTLPGSTPVVRSVWPQAGEFRSTDPSAFQRIRRAALRLTLPAAGAILALIFEFKVLPYPPEILRGPLGPSFEPGLRHLGMGWNRIKQTQSAGRTRVASVVGLLLAAVLAFCSAALALRASPDTSKTRPDFTGLRPYPSRVAAAGCPLLLLVVFSGLTWYLLREIQTLRRKQTELARLALVASKTENAVFLTNAEGAI